MPSIEHLLHRRTDLSTFLVHLTRDLGSSQARANLLSIASDFTIEARTPLGPAAHLEAQLAGSGATQKVVCFTETPLEHAWMMIEDIDNRNIQFSPYGLVFTKTTARRSHCNPVWYTDISTRGGRSWPVAAVNALVAEAVETASSGGSLDVDVLRQQPVFLITPFIEQMGPTQTARKEFWWEREWRRINDFSFRPRQVVAFLVPEDDHVQFKQDMEAAQDYWVTRPRPFLDPSWGLERMIAELAGVDPQEIGPFPDA